MKTSASPIKSAVEEIDELRRLFRTTMKHYGAAVEADLAKLREGIAAKEVTDKNAAARISTDLARDARDIVTLIRTMEIKPDKGRRRDLKKIEGVVEELQKIVAKW